MALQADPVDRSLRARGQQRCHGAERRRAALPGARATHRGGEPAGRGAEVPDDRPIDGVDQLEFFLGGRERSSREGFVFYIKHDLRALKWRDWKMHFVWEVEPNTGPIKLETPYIFNLIRDPKEETSVTTEENWVRGPMLRMLSEFQQSLTAHPPIPPGAPDDYNPA